MSREIKFRVWSEEDRKYRTDCNLTRLFNSVTGTPATIYSDEGDRFNIEQYTGLKDKNGKDIYEGDIVKINGWWNANGPAGYDENQCIVRWDTEITGYEPFNNYDCDCDVYHYANKCEVIDNIHENPELLGGEE